MIKSIHSEMLLVAGIVDRDSQSMHLSCKIAAHWRRCTGYSAGKRWLSMPSPGHMSFVHLLCSATRSPDLTSWFSLGPTKKVGGSYHGWALRSTQLSANPPPLFKIGSRDGNSCLNASSKCFTHWANTLGPFSLLNSFILSSNLLTIILLFMYLITCYIAHSCGVSSVFCCIGLGKLNLDH